MRFNELPAEIVIKIIYALTDGVGVILAFRYRSINKLFAAEIFKNVVTYQPGESFALPDDLDVGFKENARIDLQMNKLFSLHGRRILLARVLELRGFPSPLFDWIRAAAKQLANARRMNSKALYKIYVNNICTSVAANMDGGLHRALFPGSWLGDNLVLAEFFEKTYGPLLVHAAVAVGDTKVFEELSAKHSAYHMRYSGPFKDVLTAAVGAGKITIAENIFKKILGQTSSTGPGVDCHSYTPTTVPSRRHPSLANLSGRLYNVVEIAIRIHQNGFAQRTYAIMQQCSAWQLSLGWWNTRWKEECIRSSNTEMFYSLLRYNNTDKPDSNDVKYMLHQGSGRVLENLLRDGRVDPHVLDNTTPLQVAFERNPRHSNIRLLLRYGADIDAAIDAVRVSGRAASLLFQAVDQGDEERVALLLSYGADPEPEGHAGWSAISLSLERKHDDITKMLMEAKAQRNASAKD